MKLYADESDSAAVRSLGLVVVSCLARVEVPAAIWRKHRLGELGEADAAVLTAAFEADYFGTADEASRFHVIGIVPPLLDVAARLVATRGLRAYDAMQLASGRAAREADGSCDAFACTDAALRTAAAAEGFALVP